MSDIKKLYINPVALIFLMHKALVKVLIAGRGFGKSFLIGVSIMMKVWKLPRSRGLLIGATYSQLLTNILTPMKTAWSLLGYKEWDGEDGDYVVCKAPPEHFKTPYSKPDTYKNIITFWNGTTVVLGSMDRPQLIRGASYDWSIGDEALLYKQEHYEQIVVPTIRGSHMVFQHMPGHLTQELYSSMPIGSVGAWLLEKEVEARNPENDTFYIEGTSWHNRKILTDKVLKMWKRSMTRISYLIEVMNKRVNNIGNRFYPALSEKHWYTAPYVYDYIDSLEVTEEMKRDCRWDGDYDPTKPLIVSHDFGAFNCIVVAQAHDHDVMFGGKPSLRIINFLYVIHPEIIQDLASQFRAYYAHRGNKLVYQTGDKSGAKNEANSKETYFREFANILEKDGLFSVVDLPRGDISHLSRHQFIADIHKEEKNELPIVRHNLNNCKDLRVSLESAPMKADKKDKSSEKNKKIAPQHQTHGSDAYDYLLWWWVKESQYRELPSSKVSFGG